MVENILNNGVALPWWAGAAAAMIGALIAGLADRARNRRANLDRIGVVDWRTAQMAAFIIAAICALVALRV